MLAEAANKTTSTFWAGQALKSKEEFDREVGRAKNLLHNAKARYTCKREKLVCSFREPNREEHAIKNFISLKKS